MGVGCIGKGDHAVLRRAVNHQANAKFIIYLAEKGLSFHPHIPKKLSDQVGLFRAICWEVKFGNREFFYYSYRDRKGIILHPKDGDLAVCFAAHFTTKVSPLARLRILAYFRPIIPPNDAHVRLLA